MSRLVRDLMREGVVTCKADTALGEVAALLMGNHVHALFVANEQGAIEGVISDFDLLAAEWLSTDDESLQVMREMTAGELMSSPVETIAAEAPAAQAAQRMRRGGAHRLLVTEGEAPVGVISVSDLVADLAAAVSLGREKVADVMSQAMLVCRVETPLRELARAMTESGYRSVVVVDSSGAPKGIVTGFDLMPLYEDDRVERLAAGDVMHAPLTIGPQASLREAADLMIKHHYHRLVVVDPQEPQSMPLGLLSTYDIVAEMAQPESVWRS